MTFDDLELPKKPEDRGFNRLLADYVGVDIRMVEGWKRRKKIPTAYQRFIKYKMRVQAMGRLLAS